VLRVGQLRGRILALHILEQRFGLLAQIFEIGARW